MDKTNDILQRLRGRQPSIDHPDELTERIMDSLPDIVPTATTQQVTSHDGQVNSTATKPVIRRVGQWWRQCAVAACLILLLGVGATVLFTNHEKHGSDDVAIITPPAPRPLPTAPQQYPPAPKAHYASQVLTSDSLYQPPARMDDFIAKMAEYNHIEAVSLNCAVVDGDTTVVSKAYVFPDKKEINVFGRLLQAACAYDDETPGYLLNYSHQQFFFCLEDPANQMNYLWVAERINGERILIYCTHAPVGAATSSTCYIEYRNQLAGTMYN